jgi:SulP family sulfate permease
MALALNYTWTTGRRDLIAGLTVAAVALPQGIAYALIAGVDPKYGVYSAIVVTAIASIFGSSSHLVNGPTSAISLLVFSALGFIDPENRTVVFEALFLLGVLVGVIQILIAVLKLGDLTRYISESVIIGFMAAAAFLLAVGQIANALGVKSEGKASQPVLEQLWVTLVYGDPINYRAALLSVVVVVLAIALRRIVKRYRWPQIDLLIVLVVAALIAHTAGWSSTGAGGKTAVSLAAKVPQSLPSFHIPVLQGNTGTLGQLAQGALAIAFIGIIEALSIAKAIAHQTQQSIDYNRQILAEGLANLVGGFFQSVPGSGSLSRSAINFQAGAATRFSGIVSAATVAVALLLFAPLVHYVPQAALAGLLLVTAVRLVDYRRLISTVRASRYDAGLVVVTAVTGVAIDLDKAVLLGVALSILLFVPRAAKLRATELIITPERVVRDRLPADPVDPAIVIYDLEGELFFGAAPELDRYLDTLRDRISSGDVTFVVLRLKRVRHPDAVCIERLAEFLREGKDLGVRILLAGVRPDTLTILRNVGFERWFPTEQIFPEEDKEYSATLRAVRYAHSQLAVATAGAPAPINGVGRSDPPAYYLV